MRYETLSVGFDGGLCRVRFDRADAGNAITDRLVAELGAVLARCEASEEPAVTVVVLEGSPEVFCAGGDFEATAAGEVSDPGPLYDLWLRLASGPFVSISLVQGRANAGGLGFVAASDIVLAGRGASFGLSELLFGLFPACVLPFLIRRVGRQKAHYMTLMTRPLGAEEALACGLADALDEDPERLLGAHLARLRHLGRPALARYKGYLGEISGELERCRPAALAANRALFADPAVQRNIRRYVTELKFPWES
ncbi:MAG: enoyl-CoA hydratase/isomerase [Tistlia sp.]|uniref:enoyl-CoA hydratase/isomerase n=1 Tax=Tistlia sp. TaxID=3057121 RepID=UPI0034A5AA65